MKVSNIISQLEMFIRDFGDCEVEFLLSTDDLPDDLELDEIHVGYNQTSLGDETVCEFRLSC